MARKITFHVEDINFKPPKATPLSIWIEKVVQQEEKKLGTVSYVFCSDDYLHKINLEHLKHDTLTDIITFPYNRNPIEGDIFISIDRVRDNANDFNVPFEVELYRVIIHGILHLCGYLDETDEQEAEMRHKEDMCLKML